LLSCLGRVWFLRGKEDKNTDFIRSSMDYTRKVLPCTSRLTFQALALTPDNANVKFNLAFDQFQLADILRETDPSKRTVKEIERAAADLELAIQYFSCLCFADIRSLTELAGLKQPPWPKEDLIQRATMGRNTLRRQLERALQQQVEYEQIHKERLEASRKAREEEAKLRQEKAEKAAEEEKERQVKLAEERKRMADQAREWAEAAKERAQHNEETTKKRRGRKPRKTGKETPAETDAGETEEEAEATDVEQEAKPKRRRRIARGNALSDEKIVESDNDVDSATVSGDEKPKNKRRKVLSQARIVDSDDEMMDDGDTWGDGKDGPKKAEIGMGSDDGLFSGDEMVED
jgi:RNA polymerase-associated protein CTR9